MDQNNLRAYLIELMNDLQKIAINTNDAEKRKKINALLRTLFVLLDELIKQQLDKNTAKYKEALNGLKEAEGSTKKALQDIGQVASAIRKATEVAKAIDQVLGGVIALV